MRVLIVDNKDSFTYNLKHYLDQFAKNVDVLRGSEISIDAIEKYDKIILSPGPGLPEEHPILDKLLSKYFKTKSILGICLGQQAIAQFFDSSLENLEIVKHGITSEVTHFNNCILFKNIPKKIKVGHYHSWVVSKESLSKEFEITSENDEGIITSISHKKYDVKGVQFHPESILTEYGLKMIENWIKS